MRAKLTIIEQGYIYRIVWVFEDGDEGAWLGEDCRKLQPDPPFERDEWEHWTATLALADTRGVKGDSMGFFWESAEDAKAAIRVANEALKQERDLPEWARTALTQGWKPPKGWKA